MPRIAPRCADMWHDLCGDTEGVDYIDRHPTEYCSYGEKQVTGKLKNPDDSLLTADSDKCKEQKSKLDLISRQAAIEAFCDDCAGLKPGQCEYWDKCESQNVLKSLPPSERDEVEYYRDQCKSYERTIVALTQSIEKKQSERVGSG